MIVVISGKQDHCTQTAVSRWPDSVLLTCTDLSTGGWRYLVSRPLESMAVADGNVISVKDITGVLTRIHCVSGHELTGIVPQDRGYVAGEMTAFLLAWLSSLTCPVLNEPSTTCLSGPDWTFERWIATAARLGIPITPVCRSTGFGFPSQGIAHGGSKVNVTVVGRRCLGEVDKTLALQARRLADAAGVDLLGVEFNVPEAGACCVGANLWPDLSAPDVADAVSAFFQEAGPLGGSGVQR